MGETLTKLQSTAHHLKDNIQTCYEYLKQGNTSMAKTVCETALGIEDSEGTEPSDRTPPEMGQIMEEA
jgi:Tfp pilus assembly protein PilF